MTAGRPATVPRIADMNSIVPGANVMELKLWRYRLIKAAEGVSYAQIHRRAVRPDGSLVPYTTIRTAILNPRADIEMGTLAAICDALGVSLESIVAGGGK